MAEEFTPTFPIANITWTPEPKGPYDFEPDVPPKSKKYSKGAWEGTDKNGNRYLKVSCICGRHGMLFMMTKYGWKIVQENSEPKEEW